MIQLHHYPSTAAMVPHILLEELGVPFERVHVDRAVNAHKEPGYLRLNPNGLIPVLVDGDLVLYETAAIVLHLCDRHPEAGLAPAFGTDARSRFYKWLMWLTNTLQATLIVYFYPERWVDEGNAAGVSQVREHARRKVVGLLAQLDAELASAGGPWFLGQAYSALDAYVFTLCRWTRNFSQDRARELPQLGPYLQRMLARPAVQRVLANEGLQPPYV
ncbi:MAG TPA: glutathione S-transferase family protein [Ramlibacter sp.]|jgi:glutathione S-transferase|uniref:glutathione S-transferase family protein n=1 Tax=Ramlibacter sp. TaxID=1917967 RepID=UPI002D2560E8|nr:glutathione S-transferase family protein [Ramlibacter sp.]HZY17000.1 glutathione S-transferase family protein [Ramlibacter sp.]